MQGAPKGYTENLARYTAIRLPHPRESAIDELAGGDLRGARGRRAHARVDLRPAPLQRPDGLGPARRQAAAQLRLRADVQAGARADARHAHRLRRRQERRAVAPGQLHLLGARAQPRRAADGLPPGRQARLLPAVLRDDGADAAHGRDPGARGRRLLARLLQQGHARVPRARPRRALLGRGVVPGIGWVPFDPTPARSPAQSQSSALATSAAAADAGEVRNIRGGAAAVPSRTSETSATAATAAAAGYCPR